MTTVVDMTLNQDNANGIHADAEMNQSAPEDNDEASPPSPDPVAQVAPKRERKKRSKSTLPRANGNGHAETEKTEFWALMNVHPDGIEIAEGDRITGPMGVIFEFITGGLARNGNALPIRPVGTHPSGSILAGAALHWPDQPQAGAYSMQLIIGPEFDAKANAPKRGIRKDKTTVTSNLETTAFDPSRLERAKSGILGGIEELGAYRQWLQAETSRIRTIEERIAQSLGFGHAAIETTTQAPTPVREAPARRTAKKATRALSKPAKEPKAATSTKTSSSPKRGRTRGEEAEKALRYLKDNPGSTAKAAGEGTGIPTPKINAMFYGFIKSGLAKKYGDRGSYTYSATE